MQTVVRAGATVRVRAIAVVVVLVALGGVPAVVELDVMVHAILAVMQVVRELV